MTYKKRNKLRDELYEKFKNVGIIDKNNHFLRVNIKKIDKNLDLKEKWNKYNLEFRSEEEAIYCILHKDDFENHRCPICNNISQFYIKPRKNTYRQTCGKKECIDANTKKISKSEKVLKKREDTNLKRFGVKYCGQSKELMEKAKQTNLEKYGTENPFGNKDIQEKIKQSNLERYGVEYPLQSEELFKKFKDTNLKRYGVEYPSQLDEIKNKIVKTNIKRFGVKHQMLCKEIKDKVAESCRKTWEEHYDSIDPLLKEEVLLLFNNQYTISDIYSKDTLFKDLILKKYIEKNRQLRLIEIANIFGKSPQTIKNRIVSLNLLKYFYIKDSELELKFKYLLECIGLKEDIDFVRCDRSVLPITESLGHQELDFLLKNKGIAFEINDIISHNLNRKHQYYHINKTLKCLDNNIRLIHIWEWELKEEDIWNKLSKWIINLLNDSKNNIDSKDCILKEVTINEENDFLNNYHLQGYIKSSICIGLYYNNELIQLMSFSKYNDSNHEYELVRMSTKYGINIIDGYKKLLDYFIKQYNPRSIITYCNLDKDDIKEYKKLKFELLERTLPINIKFDKNYQEVYNCGKDIYIKRFKEN